MCIRMTGKLPIASAVSDWNVMIRNQSATNAVSNEAERKGTGIKKAAARAHVAVIDVSPGEFQSLPSVDLTRGLPLESQEVKPLFSRSVS